MPRDLYLVCERCGHVECVPAHYDLIYKCENCRVSTVCCPFDIEDQAYDYSQEILDKNEAYKAFQRGEMEHGW